MKKYMILFVVLIGAAFSFQTMAQERYPVFSPSVFIGGQKAVRRNSTTGVAGTYTPKPVSNRRIILKFHESQMEMTDAQKTELLKVVDRIRAGQVSQIDLRAFSSKRWSSHVRLINLLRFFKDYTPDTFVKAVIADEESVLEKNNNTVYLTEIP